MQYIYLFSKRFFLIKFRGTLKVCLYDFLEKLLNINFPDFV
ncbi:hypothetical protein SAN_1149 [Streptococcus agalactiae COH1]|nr:hypothetical protein SAN_1149 [Streptococcus agalactiae COH1]